ncbi:MAG: gamma-glutamyl-gamma-aminobutyrate hydrolase family protein [Oscillospiraceae bacterium]|nr:gamma-glutamyl-gamma-aminobutyrate hydrolase family protein [Oscillospiraceae bacterium]
MFCTNCGSKIHNDDAFCTNCGVQKSTSSFNAPPPPPREAVQYSPPVANNQQAFIPPPPHTIARPPKKSGSISPGIIIGIVFAIVVVLVVGLFFLFRFISDSKSNDEPVNTPPLDIQQTIPPDTTPPPDETPPPPPPTVAPPPETPEPTPTVVFIENPRIIITTRYNSSNNTFADQDLIVSAVKAAGGIPILPSDDALLADMLRNGNSAHAESLASSYDGLILTGGGDISARFFGQTKHPASAAPDENRDIAEIALAQAFINAGKPILGMNRGMQVINVSMGGDIIQDIPDLLGIDDSVHSGANSHTIQIEQGTWLYSLFGSSLTVNSSHHQSVGRVADGFIVVARVGDVIEAMEKGNVLGIQFNNTGLPTGALESIFNDFIGRCSYYTPAQ